MKHNTKITLIILGMFLITQFLGIYVVNHYINNELPLGFETHEIEETGQYNVALVYLLFAFVIAVILMLLLSKLNFAFILKAWFFIVVTIALMISFNSFIPKFLPFNFNILEVSVTWIFISLLALVLAYVKIFKRNFLVHNLTEIFIYPGIAAIFVQILNVYTVVALLVLISVYDIWAVWHSGIMQKMAKYQIKKLNIFSGFFVSYIPKNMKLKLSKMKPAQLRKKKIKVNVAILGGGDVVFPIIAAGVMLKTLGIYSALFVAIGATIGLAYLLFFSEKKKFYPAMPFISTGIFLGIALSYLVLT
ncbi:MAG: hypothetical protein A2639_00430 [Candidatus Staskawiczbacteria bacterium RIFCSPHIGHO2_01_FULL_34_27]|uniref:Uncharacterized protein n=1 Tax=Candidatus Staskawiczbacteria bacterium RIFCSPHIGHO2_01_FULL_34_27 TaxID=1802199 RepID=A0A1G2HJ45_9BACT|nr:hypothetical protein [Candidatus Pacearchaeota archaeon]OGZ62536.1 MAG: hypothetical protein A2639_00430 [Candidatus Staskawiczbacteria bacterium RIFCSPHIGHO2_01_FULL_34_27]